MILPAAIKTVDPSAFSDDMDIIVYISSSETQIPSGLSDIAYLAFEANALPSELAYLANSGARYSLGVAKGSVVYDKALGMYLCKEGAGYSVLSYTPETDGLLSIPSVYDSLPVLRIRSHAIVVPEGVTDLALGSATERLDPRAVAIEGSLRSVYFPASVKTAETGAIVGKSERYFFGAKTLPSGFSAAFAQDLSASTVLYSVAPGTLCETEQYLYISHADAVTLLCFYGNVDTLNIPSTLGGKKVTCIKTGFFEGYYTRKITIPASVVTVEKHSFSFTRYAGTAAGSPQYYSAEIYFSVLDPVYSGCSYDLDFIRIDAEDTTPKTVYFGGESIRQTYPGYSKNVSA